MLEYVRSRCSEQNYTPLDDDVNKIIAEYKKTKWNYCGGRHGYGAEFGIKRRCLYLADFILEENVHRELL